jgi:hypothetical protein
MPNWLPLGTHFYYVDNDVFVLQGHGVLSLSDTKQLLDICLQIGKRYGYWLVLADATAGVNMSPDARRYIGEMSKAHPERLSVTAIFGAGIIERTLVLFVKNAIKLLHGSEMPIETFTTAAEARTWLGYQRESLRRKLHSAPAPLG